MRAINSPELADYQWRLVRNVERAIQSTHFCGRPKTKLLDAGCDSSGKQLWHLAGLTKGEIIGINIEDGFPSPDAVKLIAEKPNAKLEKMDAMNLAFPDESFDVVISANVMEHVRDPRRYIQECGRVLKKTGIAYFEAGPIWTGARGHHIHEDLVHDCCSPTENYRNDGSIIPDWSHLVCDESQMRSIIDTKVSPKTVRWILHMIYHSDVLNRKGWHEIRAAFDSVFPITDLQTQSAAEANPQLKPRDALEDFQVDSFELVARKAPQPRMTRLLMRIVTAYRRRIRLLGLAVSRRLGPSLDPSPKCPS
jgi:ubiquinone/menaquinone biosynthesis C-methylase UbiE